MTTATRTRKPRSKPARSVRLTVGGSMPEELMIEMIVGAVTSYYFVTEIPADFGRGFQVCKLLCDGGETYHVNIEVQHGRHTCDCKGGTYNGHCKHSEALVALIRSGKLPQRPATPSKPVPSTSTPATPAPVILPMPAPMKPAATAQTRECIECGKPCTSIYCDNCNGI